MFILFQTTILRFVSYIDLSCSKEERQVQKPDIHILRVIIESRSFLNPLQNSFLGLKILIEMLFEFKYKYQTENETNLLRNLYLQV